MGPPALGTVMDSFLDLTSLIFLVAAVLIFLKLRSVLGQRTGAERPPSDVYKLDQRARMRPGNDDNRGSLSQQEILEPEGQVDKERLKAHRGVDRVVPGETALNATLHALVEADPRWDITRFLEGAEAAYEMILTAFADGDRATLGELLSEGVYTQFDSVIRAREQKGARAKTQLVALRKPTITHATLEGALAQITLCFNARLISVVTDSQGTVLEGDPETPVPIEDVWTFARSVSSRDPNWKLVATRATTQEEDSPLSAK